MGTHCKLCFCKTGDVWIEQEGHRVREQSLEFVYHNIVQILSTQFKPVL